MDVTFASVQRATTVARQLAVTLTRIDARTFVRHRCPARVRVLQVIRTLANDHPFVFPAITALVVGQLGFQTPSVGSFRLRIDSPRVCVGGCIQATEERKAFA